MFLTIYFFAKVRIVILITKKYLHQNFFYRYILTNNRFLQLCK
nr:MAG TPA: hypothetical protein [Caudoviricetes sp.]